MKTGFWAKSELPLVFSFFAHNGGKKRQFWSVPFPSDQTTSFVSLFDCILQACGETLATTNWLGDSQAGSSMTLSQEHPSAKAGSWKQLPFSLCMLMQMERAYWFHSKEQVLMLCSWQELLSFLRCWVPGSICYSSKHRLFHILQLYNEHISL